MPRPVKIHGIVSEDKTRVIFYEESYDGSQDRILDSHRWMLLSLDYEVFSEIDVQISLSPLVLAH